MVFAVNTNLMARNDTKDQFSYVHKHKWLCLEQLMNLDVVDAGMAEQLKTLRVEMERAWEDKCVARKDHG